MNVVITFSVIAIVLFISSYVTKRRFGLLGLALAAGATLSGIWDYEAGLIVGSLGILPAGSLATAVALSAIVMLPAAVLLFHGYSYKSFIGRTVGAFLFTMLSLAFLVEPLGYVLSVEGFGADAYRYLIDYKDTIIGIGMIIAVADLFLTKPAKYSRR